jgi:hypothetical protein
MRAASKSRGIEITSISRPIRLSDFRDFDIILAMDRQNRGRIILGIVFKNQDFDSPPRIFDNCGAFYLLRAQTYSHYLFLCIYLFCGC